MSSKYPPGKTDGTPMLLAQGTHACAKDDLETVRCPSIWEIVRAARIGGDVWNYVIGQQCPSLFTFPPTRRRSR